MFETRHAFTVPLAMITFVAVFLAIGQLGAFLSRPIAVRPDGKYDGIDAILRADPQVLLALATDAILVIVFILVHSFMRLDGVKALWKQLHIDSAERCIYNLCSSAALIFLTNKWQRVDHISLWVIDIEARTGPVFLLFALVHAVGWLVIYGGCVIMDLPEIIGLKQVVYDLNGHGTPFSFKSEYLVRLYGHVRHPSLSAFVALLWLANVMSVDRLLLAILLTLYMKVAWRTDATDVAYHREQLEHKKVELID